MTPEQGRDIVWGDDPDWEKIETDVVGNNRWSIFHEGIFKQLSSGKFYKLTWQVGATEMQEERPFEMTDPKPIQVKKSKKTIEFWEEI